MALDSTRGQGYCSGMDAVESMIPEGCESLWNAATPDVDPAAVLRRAAERACRTHRDQAVRLPSGQVVIVHPGAVVAA